MLITCVLLFLLILMVSCRHVDESTPYGHSGIGNDEDDTPQEDVNIDFLCEQLTECGSKIYGVSDKESTYFRCVQKFEPARQSCKRSYADYADCLGDSCDVHNCQDELDIALVACDSSNLENPGDTSATETIETVCEDVAYCDMIYSNYEDPLDDATNTAFYSECVALIGNSSDYCFETSQILRDCLMGTTEQCDFVTCAVEWQNVQNVCYAGLNR